MKRPGLTGGMTIAGVALAVLFGVLNSVPGAWAQAPGLDPCSTGQPCFTDVTDIISGRRHLLRTDDLVLTYRYGFGPSEALGNLLLTGDSQVTSILPSSLGVVGSVATPTVTAARPFDTPMIWR